MKKIVLLAFILLISLAPGLPAMGNGPERQPESKTDPGSLIAGIGDTDEAWRQEFTSEFRRIGENGVSPSMTALHVAVRYLHGESLPDDPKAAAQLFMQTLKRAELSLRKGEPPNQVGLELRMEWRIARGRNETEVPPGTKRKRGNSERLMQERKIRGGNRAEDRADLKLGDGEPPGQSASGVSSSEQTGQGQPGQEQAPSDPGNGGPE